MDIPRRIYICHCSDDSDTIGALKIEAEQCASIDYDKDTEEPFCDYDNESCDAIECAVIPVSDIEKIREAAINTQEFVVTAGYGKVSTYHKIQGILDILKDGE